MNGKIITKPDEDFFRGLFERIGDGILLFAGDRIVYCNQACFTAFGYSDRGAILDRRLADFSPEQQPDGEDSVEKECTLMAAVRKENNLRAEWVYRRANGETFPVELLLTRLPEIYPFDVCVSWRDSSKRKQVETDLQQAQHTLEKRVDERTKQIEREQQVAEGLREIFNILNSNRSVEEILSYIVRQTAHLLGINAGAVYLA